jgi:hypothetical protein
MVVSMVKPKWILELCCWKCFYSGLHMTLECRDTKLWPVSFLGASQCLSTLKGGAKPTQTEHFNKIKKKQMDGSCQIF